MRNRIKAAYARAVLFFIRPALDEYHRAIAAKGIARWEASMAKQREEALDKLGSALVDARRRGVNI